MDDILELWNRAPKPTELTKAMVDEAEAKQEVVVPKSAMIDPLNVTNVMGTRQKPTAVPYDTLRRMASIPAVSAIINTRLNQVARFAKRPRFDGDIGFRIGLKDPDAKMTDAQRKRAREIEEFFLKTGWQKNKGRKDNFDRFLRKITRDSLELDALTFEKVKSFKGEVAELWAVDAGTIELVVNNPVGEGTLYELPVYRPETKSGQKNIGEIDYVQKINGTVVAEYTEDDLAYGIRNPRTDIRFTDFGMSELETLIEVVTGIVNGVRYNTSYFSHSHLPQGVLEMVGKYKDKHLEGFKRHWKNLTTGAPGKWSVPVMALEDGQGFKFTPFKNSNKDMEFNEFLEFLFNIACAVFQIDPNEVGFKSWTSGSGMNQSDNTSVKIDESKDKGFVPLMTFLSDLFNEEVVDEIDPEFVFEWVGVDEEDEDKKLERQKTQLEMGKKTVNEIRREDDQDEIEAEWANAPANAQLIQVYMAEMQAKQAEQQQAQGAEQQGAEQEQAQATADDQHGKQLEIMDKQHEQTIEQKKLDHEHQTKLAEMQAKAKAQEPKKDKIKKSIENEFRSMGIDIDWTDY